jgi:hypothetical protein
MTNAENQVSIPAFDHGTATPARRQPTKAMKSGTEGASPATLNSSSNPILVFDPNPGGRLTGC